jgi:hypothetical protein
LRSNICQMFPIACFAGYWSPMDDRRYLCGPWHRQKMPQ